MKKLVHNRLFGKNLIEFLSSSLSLYHVSQFSLLNKKILPFAAGSQQPEMIHFSFLSGMVGSPNHTNPNDLVSPPPP